MVNPLSSELPILQAPMAGGPSTPALVAAVSAAGGFGFVAAGYLSALQLRDEIEATRTLTGSPFGVNLFLPSPPTEGGERGQHDQADAAIARYAATLQPEANRLGVSLGQPRWDDDDYPAKLDLVASSGVEVVSFTFGCPDSAAVDRLHSAGSQVAITVTGADEAALAESAGADLLVVQGTEAGGHQATFNDDEPNQTPLLTALAEIRDTVRLPLIASGGIMVGRDLAEVLVAGAIAAQLGTAFLCTPEAGTSAIHRRALTEPLLVDTTVTRAYSGRYARGLLNRFAVEHPDAPAGYPAINHLTRPIRAAATASGDVDIPNLWAGTRWTLISSAPAGEIVRRIAAGARPSAPRPGPPAHP
ncbi:MAG TPA: nitronate monooxygenase [Jatrophihabitans sp.]